MAKRFSQEDTFKMGWNGHEEFFDCFDSACVDYAITKGMQNETHFREIFNKNDIVDSPLLINVWKQLAE
jgi:hypothetical protein